MRSIFEKGMADMPLNYSPNIYMGNIVLLAYSKYDSQFATFEDNVTMYNPMAIDLGGCHQAYLDTYVRRLPSLLF